MLLCLRLTVYVSDYDESEQLCLCRAMWSSHTVLSRVERSVITRES